MNINIAICDDNKIFIDNMKTKIIKISKNMKYNTEIFIYTDGNILLNEICEEKRKHRCSNVRHRYASYIRVTDCE